ncbi:MAG: hypothetical protein V2G52_06335 [bacterium JZ-2024 1]
MLLKIRFLQGEKEIGTAERFLASHQTSNEKFLSRYEKTFSTGGNMGICEKQGIWNLRADIFPGIALNTLPFDI